MAVVLFEAAHVLIWSEGDRTYRLEGQFPLKEALELAESIGEKK